MGSIIKFLGSVPRLLDLIDSLVNEYTKLRIGSMRAAHREGIKRAVQEQDQRDLERAIGNPNAGELSGIPGTEVRDSLPSVRP